MKQIEFQLCIDCPKIYPDDVEEERKFDSERDPKTGHHPIYCMFKDALYKDEERYNYCRGCTNPLDTSHAFLLLEPEAESLYYN